MKYLFLTSIFLLLAFLVKAQNRDFDGTWSGKLTTSRNETFSKTFYIEDNNVYSVTENEDGTRVQDLIKHVRWSKGLGDQLNYVWINKSKVWTETQVYSLVWINNYKLSVHFLRHVCNKNDNDNGTTDWGYTATGYLYKEL